MERVEMRREGKREVREEGKYELWVEAQLIMRAG